MSVGPGICDQRIAADYDGIQQLGIVVVRVVRRFCRPRDGQREQHILVVDDPDPLAEAAGRRVLFRQDVGNRGHQPTQEILPEAQFQWAVRGKRLAGYADQPCDYQQD